MAINKNFVIKNGVQVGTDLIVGDSDTKKVGIGTTIAGYTLHVAATNAGGRGGIGATDAVITGVGTIKDLLVTGFSGFSSDISVTGVVSARSFGIGTTEIIDRGMRLSGIASLDAITINTIEQAIRVGPNSFTDLKVTGISTFIGIATFSTGIDIKSGVSTFSAPLRLGFAHTTDHAGVALGATVGFGTSAFFRDDAAIFMGSDSDLKIHHDGSNSRIQDVGTGDLIIQGSADIKLQSASAENYIVANDTGSVELYFDNSKKTETTSGGFKVTGITTLTNRLHVQAGVSTFDADVRFGIGATVGFGTSAFFKDDAAIYLGDDSDLRIYSDGSTSFLKANDLRLQSLTGESYITNTANGAVVLFYDDSNKLATTSGGLNVTGITTFSDRINVVSGVSTFQDDAKLTFGAQTDLLIQHDGTDTEIYNKTGNLKIRANDLDIQDYTNGHSMITADQDGSVDLFYDNYNALQTTPQGINVSGVTTSNRLNISGVSTFTSIGSNLIPDTDGSRNIGAAGSEWQDLHIDGTANIDTLDVDATSNFADDVTLVAAGSSTILFDASGLDLTFQDNIRAKFGTGKDLAIYHDGLNSYIQDTGTGDLNISGSIVRAQASNGDTLFRGVEDGAVELYFDNSKKVETTSGGLNITGITTISDRLQVTSGISTFYDTTQSTSATTGAVVLDGGLGVAKNVNIGGNLTVTGTTTFNGGTITLGDADTDNVVFSADVDSNIIPDDDDSFDLGSSTKEWQDLFLDGTAHIDVLDVDETAFVTTKLTVGTGVTIQNHGGVSIAGISTFGGNVNVGSGGDVTLTASIGAGSSTILFDSSAGTVTFQDNLRANFGTSGDGLSIFHNGGNSMIEDNGTGNLEIRTNGTKVTLQGGGNPMINANKDAQVELYHNNVKAVETTADGILVGTGVTIQKNGGVSIAGITTIGGTMSVSPSGNERLSVTANTVNLLVQDNTTDAFTVKQGSNEYITVDTDNASELLTLGNTTTNPNTLILGGKTTVGTGVTIQGHGGVSIAGITTIGGTLTLHGAAPNLLFTESDANPDFGVLLSAGQLKFQDMTATANILTLDDDKIQAVTNLDALAGVDITGALTVGGGGDVTLTASVGSGSSTILFDSSAGTLTLQDNIRLNIGTGSDLSIYHNGTDSYIQEQGTGNLKLVTPASGVITIEEADANIAVFTADSGVQLNDGANNARLNTTTDGVDIGGTGSIRVPNGTTAQRNASPAAGDFRYNTTTGKFEGYTDEWGDIGGSGGVEETSTSVSTTSATSTGSFAIASFRSASIIAQITQGSNYQVGRYLVIHDGTNVTTIEESAVATGSMLGTFEGVINSSNLEFRVTMGSSSSATVKTKIDTVTV